MEDKLIQAGIKALKEFGYPGVTKDNIITDTIYSEFFRRMLDETAEEAGAMGHKGVVADCYALMDRIRDAAGDTRG